MRRRSFFSILFLLFGQSAFPQSEDTAFVNRALRNTIKIYKEAIGGQAALYNGSKYLPPKQTFEQHPYFQSEDWLMGDVHYDGELFEHVPLMYDLFNFNSKLITEHSSTGHAIELVPQKLSFFSLGGHRFEYIKADSASRVKTGFYDIVYNGITKVVAKREKLFHERLSLSSVELSYREKTRYFVRKNGNFYPAKNKASMLKILGDRKKDLKRFLKQQGASFFQNKESGFRNMATFYDTLK
jgi:hypothetical protein